MYTVFHCFFLHTASFLNTPKVQEFLREKCQVHNWTWTWSKTLSCYMSQNLYKMARWRFWILASIVRSERPSLLNAKHFSYRGKCFHWLYFSYCKVWIENFFEKFDFLRKVFVRMSKLLKINVVKRFSFILHLFHSIVF